MGKRILITESQAKLLMEEIDRNDSIQKLIFSEPSSIEFVVTNDVPDGIPASNKVHCFIPVIEGKKIGPEFIKLFGEAVNVDGDKYFQLHINVSKELRRLGIAEKLYTAFLLKGYPICYLFSNGNPNKAILNLFSKLGNSNQISTDYIYNNSGRVVGIKASIER